MGFYCYGSFDAATEDGFSLLLSEDKQNHMGCFEMIDRRKNFLVLWSFDYGLMKPDQIEWIVKVMVPWGWGSWLEQVLYKIEGKIEWLDL